MRKRVNQMIETRFEKISGRDPSLGRGQYKQEILIQNFLVSLRGTENCRLDQVPVPTQDKPIPP